VLFLLDVGFYKYINIKYNFRLFSEELVKLVREEVLRHGWAGQVFHALGGSKPECMGGQEG
jgi:hypothetical protein